MKLAEEAEGLDNDDREAKETVGKDARWAMIGGAILGAGLMGLVAAGVFVVGETRCEMRLAEYGVHRQVDVVAASRDLTAGEVIGPDDLTVKQYPVGWLPPRYTPRSLMLDLVGQPVAYSVKEGNPILTTDLGSRSRRPGSGARGRARDPGDPSRE